MYAPRYGANDLLFVLFSHLLHARNNGESVPSVMRACGPLTPGIYAPYACKVLRRFACTYQGEPTTEGFFRLTKSNRDLKPEPIYLSVISYVLPFIR